MPSKLRTASTVLLAIAGSLVLLVSLLSANLAYRGQYQIGGKTDVNDIAPDRPEVEVALRAIRGTSAAYAAGFAALFLLIALGPYRRGEVWAWWALLWGTLAVLLLILVRVPFLGVWLGAPPAFVLTGVVVLGLLLDAKRLRKP